MEPGQSLPRPQSGQPSRRSIDGVYHRAPRYSHNPIPARRPVQPRRPAMATPISVVTASDQAVASTEPVPAPTPVTPIISQPESLPPSMPVTTPPVTPPVEHEIGQSTPELSAAEQPLAPAFESAVTPPAPPRAARRRWPRRLALAGGVLLMCALVGSGFWYYRQQHSPEAVMQAGLSKSLQSPFFSIHSTTPNGTSAAEFDASQPKTTHLSSEATIRLHGAQYGIRGYGSSVESFFAYSTFPDGIDARTQTTVRDAWVQVRTASKQPAGVPQAIVHAIDPRYHIFTPVVRFNASPAQQKQLLRYAQDQRVYAYDPKAVTTTSWAGERVYAYPIKLNLAYLKVMQQTIVSTFGASVQDLQSAATSLDYLKHAKNTLYISIGGKEIVGFRSEYKGSTYTYTYDSNQRSKSTSRPQTKLAWASFATSQLQLENMASARLASTELDALRTSQLRTLQTLLTAYNVQSGNYPTFNDMNNQEWLAENLPGFDPELVHDTGGTSLAVSATPKPGLLAYQPKASDGTACDNAARSQCSQYVLTLLDSRNQPLTVTNQ